MAAERDRRGWRAAAGRCVLALAALSTSVACAGLHPPPQRALSLLPSPAPAYPPELLARGVEGYAIVGYRVGSDGRAHDPVILYSEPGEAFDRVTLEGAAQWRFLPRRVDGYDAETRAVSAVAYCLPESIAQGIRRIEACRSLEGRALVERRLAAYEDFDDPVLLSE